MVAFSPSALRLLDAAVAQLADSPQQQRWSSWERDHPEIRRRPGAAWNDWSGTALPGDILEIALIALGRLSMQLRNQRAHSSSEDEVSELDNELSQIRSIERFLHEAPHGYGAG